ncbi:small ribosomal subunit protein eS12-like [Vicugna pacos]|uniref:40S ribosomal protein S12 n=1 Tax=Vicugna pacos TaxID=30538 RepID=A0ABM5D2C5_VICPA
MAKEGTAAGGIMDINAALQEVMKTTPWPSMWNSQSCKALDPGQPHIWVLASIHDEPMYVKLVEALCAEHQINLIKVDDNKKLGEWVGLCKTDIEGKPCTVFGCSCAVFKDSGKDSQAKDVIKKYFKCKK